MTDKTCKISGDLRENFQKISDQKNEDNFE